MGFKKLFEVLTYVSKLDFIIFDSPVKINPYTNVSCISFMKVGIKL